MPVCLQKVWQNEGKGNEREQNEEGLAAGHVVSPRLLKRVAGATVAILITRLEKSKWIKWLRLLR